MSKKRTASELILMCLNKYGEQSLAELSQKLCIHPKALSRTIGYLKKKRLVEAGTPLTPIIKTEFGIYQSTYSAPNKWKLTVLALAEMALLKKIDKEEKGED
jgi:predicted ArsR family transcriptional regulator